MDITIIKIAGSVITDKKSGKPKVNFGNIRFVARVLKNFKKPYILLHGSGSFGHPLAKKTGVDTTVISPEQLLAFAKIQGLQNRLNYLFCDVLIREGIPAYPAQASSHAIMERGRLVRIDTEATLGLVRLGLVPVSYGVPAFDRIWGSTILSYDQIAPFVARQIGAKQIIEAEDVAGICAADPKVDKNAKLVEKVNLTNYQEVATYISGSLTTDVTGGMKQKYCEFVEASKAGIVCQLVHFKALGDALDGKPVGTTFNLIQ